MIITQDNIQGSFKPDVPIAIVGIGCRFPGNVKNSEEFWELLIQGKDAIIDIPESRWNLERYYDPNPKVPGRMYVKQGGFLQQDITSFDPSFFQISPREAAQIDPQQRLLLEVTWEALQDAAICPETLAGSKTGVFIGGFLLDSKVIQLGAFNREKVGSHTGTAATMAILSNRISYLLDLRGPSFTVDTACSSSLVSLHLACRSLWNRESSLALTGGVNVMLNPNTTIAMSKGQFLSPDARCKAFDARANGYVRSEGAGVLVLKRLPEALKDKDSIYAVIRGTAINQDGKTNGITVPNEKAQIEVMQQAYQQCNIAPKDVCYVEAHGTGTAIGDPIEAKAIGSVIGAMQDEGKSCLLSSVKTNIGHLEAAAGVAGVIKTALCLKHKKIPPHLHLQQVNPAIPLEEMNLEIPTQLKEISQKGKPLYAGINSFGYGGTNAHIVLQNFSQEEISQPKQPNEEESFFLPISANSSTALSSLAKSYLSCLKENKIQLNDLCFSSATTRTHHKHRFALFSKNAATVVKNLSKFISEELVENGYYSSHQIESKGLVFVYSGMGPQRLGMGRKLIKTESVFKETVEKCDSIFQNIAGWSIAQILKEEQNPEKMARTEFAQPANFVLQVALTELLKSWGIYPKAIIGHSVGEVSAAFVAGKLSLKIALLVSYHRSRLQQKTAGTGTLLAVGMPREKVEEFLIPTISVAAVNSPNSVTLAGPQIDLERLASQFETLSIFNRFLKVEVPYHSPQMEVIKSELLESLKELKPLENDSELSLYSTVTGDKVDFDIDAEYWWKNVREPVFFAKGIENLIRDNYSLFLELSPHPVLSPSIREVLKKCQKTGEVVPTLERNKDELQSMQQSLTQLYALGSTLDWSKLYGEKQKVKLPKYPWDRQNFWEEAKASLQIRQEVPVHPFLQQKQNSPELSWNSELNGSLHYLQDHQVEETSLFPGAGYVEIGLAIDQFLHGERSCVIEQLEFLQPFILAEESLNQIRIQWDSEGKKYKVYQGEEDKWKKCSQGKIYEIFQASSSLNLNSLCKRCSQEVPLNIIYDILQTRGLNYGASFRGIKQLWFNNNEIFAQLALPANLTDKSYRLHPVLLDSSFQTLIAILLEYPGVKLLPTSIKSLKFYQKPKEKIFCYGKITKRNEKEVVGDLYLCDENGEIFVEVQQFKCQFLQQKQIPFIESFPQWLYQYHWIAQKDNSTTKNETFTWIFLGHSQDFLQKIASDLESKGDKVCWISNRKDSAWKNLLFEEKETNYRLLDLRFLDLTYKTSPIPGSIESILEVLATFQFLSGKENIRYLLLTKNLHQITEKDPLLNLSYAPLLGILRTATTGFPELNVTTIDLGTSTPNQATMIQLLKNLASEDEIALRENTIFYHRLHHENFLVPEEKIKTKKRNQVENFEIELQVEGKLDTLEFVETKRQSPKEGEVEIKVSSVTLNFKDLMKVMGIISARVLENTYFGNTIGMEGAGKIVAIGEGVTEFKVGDEVCASGPGFMKGYVTTSAKYTAHKLKSLSMDETANIIVWCTAYEALIKQANLKKGEKVLIHSATGGIGLAAIELAKWCGAEIYATAGSESKRDYLKARGIQHISDSRTTRFHEDIMKWTAGVGVDVVINFSTNEKFIKSLDCLAPFGRFIEIGKVDIDEDNSLALRPFNENLSFITVDFDRMLKQKPDYCKDLLAEILERLSQGVIKPLPTRIFQASEVTEAFRFMGQAKHIGKINLNFEDPQIKVQQKLSQRNLFQENATYLITGGFGGFGLQVAHWMLSRGAKNLVLLSRRDPTKGHLPDEIKRLTKKDCQVKAIACDVSSYDQLEEVFKTIQREMPPLKGIFHAAMVLEDGLLEEMDQKRLSKVIEPKATGAWNLHKLTTDISLDFMIFFSSISAITAPVGQGNYVAANCFLDSLAKYRQGLGLAAVSINWGVFEEVGVVAKNPYYIHHLKRNGITGFRTKTALKCLEQIILNPQKNMGIFQVDWQQWSKVNGVSARSPRFSEVLKESALLEQENQSELKEMLLSVNATTRQELLSALLIAEVAKVLRIPTEKLNPQEALQQMGMDSIMILELATTIHLVFGAEMSSMEILKAGNIEQIASLLMKKMGISQVELQQV